MKVQRYKCKHCGNDDYERVSFVKGNRSYSNRFAKYVVDLLKAMTIQEVSKRLGVSWDVVKDIHMTYLKRHYSKPSLQGVQCIGIDEFAVRKG
ncbi:helix-turn-helix domain-containing protein, partial [Porphyromonas levii]